MEVDKSRAALTSGETPLPLCVDDQERRSGVSPLCAGTIREEGLTMEVDKSRAALTSGETPLPLCGDEAVKAFFSRRRAGTRRV